MKRLVFSEVELEKIKRNRKRMVVGTPYKVKEELLIIASDYQTDEIMIITNIFDFKAKLDSYKLLAEVFDL